GVGYFLTVDLNNEFDLLQVFYPKSPRSGSIDPRNMYNRDIIKPTAFFKLNNQYDDEYIIVPLNFARKLLNYENRRSYLEIKVAEGYEVGKVKDELRSLLGENFSVRDTEEQHANLLLT